MWGGDLIPAVCAAAGAWNPISWYHHSYDEQLRSVQSVDMTATLSRDTASDGPAFEDPTYSAWPGEIRRENGLPRRAVVRPPGAPRFAMAVLIERWDGDGGVCRGVCHVLAWLLLHLVRLLACWHWVGDRCQGVVVFCHGFCPTWCGFRPADPGSRTEPGLS
jgi:hypothetical protein